MGPKSLHQSLISFFFFIFFLFSDFSAKWNIPVLQRNARSAGYTSMPNRPQCIAQVNKSQFPLTIPLIGPNKKYHWMLRYLSFWHWNWLPTFFGYLTLIKIKYSRYNNRRVRTLESDPEITVRRLGKIIQGFFCCSIRSQHSQSHLEMVWRDSFPRGSYSFIENFRSYHFCPVYFVLPRLTEDAVWFNWSREMLHIILNFETSDLKLWSTVS